MIEATWAASKSKSSRSKNLNCLVISVLQFQQTSSDHDGLRPLDASDTHDPVPVAHRNGSSGIEVVCVLGLNPDVCAAVVHQYRHIVQQAEEYSQLLAHQKYNGNNSSNRTEGSSSIME